MSLNNPRLGFVCVSEDVTGQFGLCGYFKEYDHNLSPDERLIFSPDERVPLYDAKVQPLPPQSEWNEVRLLKATRNYAVEYIRNGIASLIEVVGDARAEALAGRAARLIGLQHYSVMAAAIGAVDGVSRTRLAFWSACFPAWAIKQKWWINRVRKPRYYRKDFVWVAT